MAELKDSPCIALCSTALGDPVCRGCGRTFDEVSAWTVLSEADKDAIWSRLSDRLRLVEIGLCLEALIELEAGADGAEWAHLLGGPQDGAVFRLQRGADGLRLLVRQSAAPGWREASLAPGTAASAAAFAKLLAGLLREG